MQRLSSPRASCFRAPIAVADPVCTQPHVCWLSEVATQQSVTRRINGGSCISSWRWLYLPSMHALGRGDASLTFTEFLLCTKPLIHFNPQGTLGSNSCHPQCVGGSGGTSGWQAQLVGHRSRTEPGSFPQHGVGAECQGPALVLGDFPASTSPVILLASPPGSPRAAVGMLSRPPH